MRRCVLGCIAMASFIGSVGGAAPGLSGASPGRPATASRMSKGGSLNARSRSAIGGSGEKDAPELAPSASKDAPELAPSASAVGEEDAAALREEPQVASRGVSGLAEGAEVSERSGGAMAGPGVADRASLEPPADKSVDHPAGGWGSGDGIRVSPGHKSSLPREEGESEEVDESEGRERPRLGRVDFDDGGLESQSCGMEGGGKGDTRARDLREVSALKGNASTVCGWKDPAPKLRWLEAQVRVVLKRVEPPAEKTRKEEEFVQKLQAIVHGLFGSQVDLSPYGSAAAGFGTVDSDLDLQLSLGKGWEARLSRVPAATGPNPDPFRRDKVQVLRALSAKLHKEHNFKTNLIVAARVPIVSVEPDDTNSVAVDISIQPRLNFGRFTVLALQSYLRVDPRVRDLVLVVKTWSKRRMVNDAFTGTLNSFSLILMVVHVLQNVEPPILPNIFLPTLPMRRDALSGGHAPEKGTQLLFRPRNPMAVIRGLDGKPKPIAFHDSGDGLVGWGKENKEPVALLLFRFFAFYATEFDWEREFISVRQGKVISLRNARFSKDRGAHIWIEDCLDDSNNVARSVDANGRARVQEEIYRAYDVLCNKGDMEALLQEAPVPAPPMRLRAGRKRGDVGSPRGARKLPRLFKGNVTVPSLGTLLAETETGDGPKEDGPALSGAKVGKKEEGGELRETDGDVSKSVDRTLAGAAVSKGEKIGRKKPSGGSSEVQPGKGNSKSSKKTSSSSRARMKEEKRGLKKRGKDKKLKKGKEVKRESVKATK